MTVCTRDGMNTMSLDKTFWPYDLDHFPWSVLRAHALIEEIRHEEEQLVNTDMIIVAHTFTFK